MSDSGDHSHSGGATGGHDHGLFGPHSADGDHSHDVFNPGGEHSGSWLQPSSGGHDHGFLGLGGGSHPHGGGDSGK